MDLFYPNVSSCYIFNGYSENDNVKIITNYIEICTSDDEKVLEKYRKVNFITKQLNVSLKFLFLFYKQQ